MPLSDLQRDTLHLYVEMINELEESSLCRNLLSEKTITYRFSMKEGLPINQEIVNLDEEHLKAFILTARLLAQDNERCSIRNLSKIFDGALQDHAIWPRFNGVRWKLNDYLDREYPLLVEGDEVTSRYLFEVFLYGHYAHRTKEKELVYKGWEANSVFFPYYKLGFLMSLSVLFSCAHEIKLVANEVIK
jgi:hypothetical protein